MATRKPPASCRVVYETEHGWVETVGGGLYYVYRKGACAGTRCGTYHFPNAPEYALRRARERCDQLGA